jgi:AraC-like DNA-binding protein
MGRYTGYAGRLREPQPTNMPHRAWFGFSFEMPPATTLVCEARETAHTLAIGTAAAVDVKWIHRGCERLYRHGLDQVAFFAADNEVHTRTIRSGEAPSSSYLFKIPRRQLIDLAGSDEADVPSDYPHLLPREDAVLRNCMVRLASTTGSGVATDMGSEIAARALIVRLIELLGGYAPDWHEDSSVFPATVSNQIVEYIDSHMHRHIGLVEIASLVGLSPSHCARKFRRTEGLSLERFVNRRRLIKALDLLRNDSVPLARVALDLGFCSQSHFTRLFSGQTGVTPAKYRKQFRRIVG